MASAPAPPSMRLLPLLPKSELAERVAEALQVGAALEHQRFNIRRQTVVDRGKDRVVALAGILDHGIGGIVDEVGVVAGAADA